MCHERAIFRYKLYISLTFCRKIYSSIHDAHVNDTFDFCECARIYRNTFTHCFIYLQLKEMFCDAVDGWAFQYHTAEEFSAVLPWCI